jgi:class 3 adenylate cyclase
MSRSCARCGAPAAGDARFCSTCGSPLEPPPGGERKVATMLFADLVGSTRLAAALDPEELRGRLAPFFEVARSALEEHGGTVEKYIGDAVMAVFGAPVAHGDDPDRAVAAALALVDRVARLDGEPAIRVGIETGEVLAVREAGDLAVTGEAVNAAARLQQAARPGQVLVGARAARACRRTRLERDGEIEATGLTDRLPTWRAVAVEEGPERARVPLIGREDDIELLRLVARRVARERTPQLVTVIGEAGIGKTRLASELFGELASLPDGWRTLVGRNPPYGHGIAFWALGEILRDAAGASLDSPVDEVEGSLRELLSGLDAEDADDVAAALAVAICATDEGSDGLAEDDLKRTWRRFVALLAAERPLAIGVDDAHWADDGLLDLLEEAAFGLHGAPILILCTGRPELAERRPDFGHAARNIAQVELLPLDPASTTRLAELLLPAGSRSAAARVADASGGNPFFAEEVSRAIGEEPEGPASERLPDTVQAAIAARIDLLPAKEKRTLQCAAVLGHTFAEDPLAALVNGSPGESLQALRRRALIEERVASGSGRYAFRHQLIRDVAYASLPRAECALLHERAAEALRAPAGERFAELAELVAYHLTRAADLGPTQARRHAARGGVLEAAATATRRGAGARGQALYEQAAALAGDDAGRIEPLSEAAEVALRRWRGDHSVRLYREAAAAAERADADAKAAGAYARAVEVGARMGGISGQLPQDELIAMLDRGRALVSPDDVVTRARLLLDEVWIAWLQSDPEGGAVDVEPDEMAAPARAGLELARQTGDVALVQSALDAVTASDWLQDRHRAAAEHTRERLELLRDAPRSHALDVERSDALHMMIECLLQTGNYREAESYAREARELDLSRGIVYSAWQRGMLPAFFLGRWDTVLEMAAGVREAWVAADRPPLGAFASSVGCAGAILGYRGEEEAGEEWLALGDELAPSSTGQAVGLRVLRSDVDLHHGRPGQAADRLEEPAGGTWWRSPFFATRAEAFVRAGRGDAAEAIELAATHAGEHRYARGILLRARAQTSGDEDLLREALVVFEEIECPYQAARTGWLLGGEARAEARKRLDDLNAQPPAD